MPKTFKEHTEEIKIVDEESQRDRAVKRHEIAIAKRTLKMDDAKLKKLSGHMSKTTANKILKKYNVTEEVETDEMTTVGSVGGGMVGEPPGPRKKKKKKREIFAGDNVFEVSSDVFVKCKGEKPKYERYVKHVGCDDAGQEIREYGLRYPRKGIIIKDSTYGTMMYLRRVKK
mgnify:CR=1 FL=1